MTWEHCWDILINYIYENNKKQLKINENELLYIGGTLKNVVEGSLYSILKKNCSSFRMSAYFFAVF